jgi:hypothetical protein
MFLLEGNRFMSFSGVFALCRSLRKEFQEESGYGNYVRRALLMPSLSKNLIDNNLCS